MFEGPSESESAVLWKVLRSHWHRTSTRLKMALECYHVLSDTVRPTRRQEGLSERVHMRAYYEALAGGVFSHPRRMQQQCRKTGAIWKTGKGKRESRYRSLAWEP